MTTTETSSSLPPFPAFPAIGRYVPLGTASETLERICRAVIAHEAISLMIGPPGLGKSLLCHLLVQRHRDTHDVVILNQAPIVDKQSLIRHLLHHLGAEFRNLPETDLHLALVDRVCGNEAAEGGLLIIVDEAQSLAPEVLEAIRMVTNITEGGQRRVTAVLAGGPKMDDILADPSMESFTQRVATRCYLHPMNWEETKTYVHRTIRDCGSDPSSTIDDSAISAIHHATAGVPRLVNQMMTQAIDCAAEVDAGMIDEDLIGQAWATLQQLPSPMVEEKTISLSSQAGSSIEFGELGSGEMQPISQGYENAMDDEELTLAPEATDERPSMANESVDDLIDVEFPHLAVPVAAAPTPDELFGEFDDEVSIPVGKVSSNQRSDTDSPTNDSISGDSISGTESSDECLAASSLEASLHDEIVGMSATCSQYTFDDTTGYQSRSVESMSVPEPIDAHVPAADFVDETVESQPTPAQPAIRINQANSDDAQWVDEESVSHPFINLVDDSCDDAMSENLADDAVPSDGVAEDCSNEHLLRMAAAATDSQDAAMSRRDDSDLLVIQPDIELGEDVEAVWQTEDSDDAMRTANPTTIDIQSVIARMRTAQ